MQINTTRAAVCLWIAFAFAGAASAQVKKDQKDLTQRAQDRLERCAYHQMYIGMAYRFSVATTAADIRNICRNEIAAYNSAADDEFNGRTAELISLDRKSTEAMDYSRVVIDLLMKNYQTELRNTSKPSR